LSLGQSCKGSSQGDREGGCEGFEAGSKRLQVPRITAATGHTVDRIDIHLDVPRVEYEKLSSDRAGQPSSAVRPRFVGAPSTRRRGGCTARRPASRRRSANGRGIERV